jgi:cell division protein FtsQ
MTITLDPKTNAPVDFETLEPYVNSANVGGAASSGVASMRRPGDIGGVAMKPVISHDSEEAAESLANGIPATVLRMDPAIARRRAQVARERAQGQSPRRWTLGVGLVAVVSLVLAVAMLYSPWMSVRTIDIRGASPEVRKTVRTIVERKLGSPMFRLPVAPLEGEIGAQPDVSSVTVERVWPEQLVVSVTARVPLAVVRVNGGAAATVDASGAVLATGADNLPVIALSIPGAKNAFGNELQTGALAILSALDETTRRAVDRVDHFGNDFVLRIGRTSVLVGRADDLAAKAMLVGSLHRTGRLPERGTIDVTVPDAVVLTS